MEAKIKTYNNSKTSQASIPSSCPINNLAYLQSKIQQRQFLVCFRTVNLDFQLTQGF